MQAQFSPSEPDWFEYTLSITMTLKDWKTIRGNVNGTHAVAMDFRSNVDDLIRQAEERFFPTQAEEPPDA